MPQQQLPDEDDDGMKEMLLKNFTSGETRAQRSLRVLIHQEQRLTGLQNKLSSQSILLKDYQENHADLMELRARHQEVQELQRELIRLQEIQFLTNSSTNQKYLNGLRTKKAADSTTKAPSSNVQTPFVTKSFPLSGRRENNGGKARKKSSKSTKRWREQGEEETEGKKKSLQGSFQDDDEDLRYFKMLEKKMESDSVESFLSAVEKKLDANMNFNGRSCKDKKGVGESRRSPRLGHCKMDEDEDVEQKITILRERLSSHRQSINGLSDEIIELRQERIELLSYLKDLLDWRAEVQGSIKRPNGGGDVNENRKDPDINSYTQQAINSKKSDKPLPSCIKKVVNLSMSPCTVSNNDKDIIQSKKGTGKQGNTKGNGLTVKESKLGERANKMWDLACKFFTPTQAHYILTTPVDAIEVDDSSSSEER